MEVGIYTSRLRASIVMEVGMPTVMELSWNTIAIISEVAEKQVHRYTTQQQQHGATSSVQRCTSSRNLGFLLLVETYIN